MRVLIGILGVLIVIPYGIADTYGETTHGKRVRQPAVAGQFYPSDPKKLAGAIESYLADARTPNDARPIAIISPHAGYIYSGQIAADTYKQASNHDYELVVILGANHTTAGFGGVSIYPAGGYETPLGVAKIDEALAADLLATDKDFTFDEAVHEREHSVEVQVPFVQHLFPEARILAAIVGSPDPGLCTRFGEALARTVADRKVLIVASCDLSHFPNYEEACRVDKKTLEAVSTLDLKTFRSTKDRQLREGVDNLVTCACGAAPILAAIVAAKRLGATNARVISYANSGDTSVGDRSRVVGYGAVAFFREPQTGDDSRVWGSDVEPLGDATLSNTNKEAMLAFARKTIRQYLTTDTTPLARGFDPVLRKKKGAFVTLKKDDELRGCIGHMADDLPLCQVVGYCALQAAFKDRRFTPVELDELSDIDIEISVLTPFEPVDGYNEIQVGRDGVLLEKNGRSAVFLPSVAVEQGWDREEMLSHLALKAGLPPDGWRKGARFYTFQADAFAENELD